MDKQYLKSIMAEHGDTQNTLAAAMGLSLSRLNAKVNERNGAAFTQREMDFIITRYDLTPNQAMRLFFRRKVS